MCQFLRDARWQNAIIIVSATLNSWVSLPSPSISHVTVLHLLEKCSCCFARDWNSTLLFFFFCISDIRNDWCIGHNWCWWYLNIWVYFGMLSKQDFVIPSQRGWKSQKLPWLVDWLGLSLRLGGHKEHGSWNFIRLDITVHQWGFVLEVRFVIIQLTFVHWEAKLPTLTEHGQVG